MIYIGSAFIVVAISAIALGGMWLIGRISLVKELERNEEYIQTVRDFHNNLVAYSNSTGSDSKAFSKLSTICTDVEHALGFDNIVYGVRIGLFQLQNAPLLPLALTEMRRQFETSYSDRFGRDAAVAIENVLMRHLGRRQSAGGELIRQINSKAKCIYCGWTAISGLPISILETFGLIGKTRGVRVRKSFLFRLWSFLLAIATLAGPAIAYLADRNTIDSAVGAIFNQNGISSSRSS